MVMSYFVLFADVCAFFFIEQGFVDFFVGFFNSLFCES